VLKQTGVAELYVAAILGHSKGQGISFIRYGKSVDTQDILRDAIALL